MKITIDIENNMNSTIPATKDIEAAILDILKDKGFDLNCEIDIKIVSKDEIQKLNREYRHIDKPTDVLSFPQFDRPPKKSDVPIALGDIVICPEMAQDDILFLIRHSTLHLLGYHHL
ncbi:rRNA maturation RNase YbeY [Candidatus Berkelbacteria bacterium RBG_13_40_8]|uniref:Endoribonuclease YbeY n=1 Tax=Candidatus Berkelbacteria bacterium RBG_13_40_8 TaxID=1797467 RepID=A0A1F5DLP8_9BACT|nr:MAG: rRNA maturation RNase YbeY [Candidatus Berkelbacteria bacterium RBG_13_40_8]